MTNSGENATAVSTPIQGALEHPINDSNSFVSTAFRDKANEKGSLAREGP